PIDRTVPIDPCFGDESVTPTKILFGQMALVVGIVLAGVWVHAVDGVAARLSAGARSRLVRSRRHAGLPTDALLPLVVLVRRLRAGDLRRRRDRSEQQWHIRRRHR